MLTAADTAATVAIDPAVLALIATLSGAGIAVLGGLLGAWIQGRREHAKWLRDARLRAFVSIETTLNKMERQDRDHLLFKSQLEKAKTDGNIEMMTTMNAQMTALAERALQTGQDIAVDLAQLRLVGPDKVASLVENVAGTMFENDAARLYAARSLARNAMRKALGIPRR